MNPFFCFSMACATVTVVVSSAFHVQLGFQMFVI